MNYLNLDNSIDNLAIPRAILEYNSRVLYNSYTVLESQLAQMDQTQDPDGYYELDSLTQSIFNLWVALGYRGTEGCGDELRN